MEVRKYRTKRAYKKSYTKAKVYTLLVTLSLATGLIIGNRVYTEYTIDGLANISAVHAAELPAKPVDVKDYAWEQAKAHGLDPVTFIVVLFGESGFKPDAININSNKTVDLGIAQINSIHKDISTVDKLNPYKAIDWAIQKRLHDGNYSAWVYANKTGIKK